MVFKFHLSFESFGPFSRLQILIRGFARDHRKGVQGAAFHNQSTFKAYYTYSLI